MLIKKIPDSTTEPGCCDFKNNRLVNIAKPQDDDVVVTHKVVYD